MKNLKMLVAVSAIATMSGCASIINGSEQSLSVATIKDADYHHTVCDLSSSKGEWVTEANDSVTVKRGHGDLLVKCENEKTGQVGTQVVESSYAPGWMIPNALWDFCILTCTIDAAVGGPYSYTTKINVEMKGPVLGPVTSTN